MYCWGEVNLYVCIFFWVWKNINGKVIVGFIFVFDWWGGLCEFLGKWKSKVK